MTTPAGSVVVVSPHLDDAVLSCWHALVRVPGTIVVTALAGAPPAGVPLGLWDAGTGAADSRVRIAERRAEDEAALALAGCTPVHLECLDGQYDPGPQDVVAALAPHVEGADVVYGPAAIGWHGDHRIVRDACLALRPDARLYADLPYALRTGFDEPGPPAYAREDVLLDENELARKLGAVAEYRTQLDALRGQFGSFESSLAHEVVWSPP